MGFSFAVHKQEGREDFTRIPNGAPGLENRSPVMWTEGVEKGRTSRQKFVELCCANLGKDLWHFLQKGTIAVGSDADIVIFDPDY